eukprot:TRINITY_DN6877_c0_g4_i1.p1 TRINITY_DN6877_c0_g4~~TRINITY_DN6877_c0_g4_i1.p1  ORF type:complete len:191 (-),score=28.73 TRINITY_DN6877_c0_g4_i1:128-700(-)
MIIYGLCKRPAMKLPQSLKDWAEYEAGLRFKIGQYIYTPLEVQHFIVRVNLGFPAAFEAYLKSRIADEKFVFRYSKANPLVNFGFSFPFKSSPPLRIYLPETIEEDLRETAGIFFLRGKLMKGKNRLQLPGILDVYEKDFAFMQDKKECITFVQNCLPEEFVMKNESFFIACQNEPIVYDKMCFDFKWNP